MNLEDYLSNVYRIIRDNFRPDSAGFMAVVPAAYAVKRALGYNQTQVGFANFKDVLDELENRGLLKTGVNSKNVLAVRLCENETTPVPQLPRRPLYRPLRNQVWFAFVSDPRAGRRFLNRRTGEVRMDAADRPAEEGVWVEIIPVDSHQEQQNTLTFLSEKGVDVSDIRESVTSEAWYREFPKKLADHDPALAAEWKRQRSRRVIEAAQAWCKQNGIDESLLFQSIPLTYSTSIAAGPSPQSVTLRELLLTAIHRMSTDELLRLRLPAQHLVAVLRPELLG